MRLSLSALAVSLALSGPALAADDSAATGPGAFQPADVFSLSQASDPQISPDGRQIAYVRRTGDIMTDSDRTAIWLVDVATGKQQPLIAEGARGARWSPDGTRIAYVGKGDGGRPQIFVIWPATGRTAPITALPQGPGALAWSPDGTRIAFTMFMPAAPETLGGSVPKPEGAKWAEPIKVIRRVTYRADDEGYVEEGFGHVFVVPADGGAPRQLTFGDYDDGGTLGWTPDSRRILFSSNRGKDPERQPLNSDIFSVDAAGGAMAQLTTRDGPDGDAVVSPDGRLVAYTGFTDRKQGYQNARLSVMNADGSNPREITTALDRSVDSPKWAADGRSIYAQYDDKGATRIARFTLEGKMTPVASGLAGGDLDRPYTGGGFSLARNGAVAFPAGTFASPPDVGYASGGSSRKLTNLNAGLFAGKVLAKAAPYTVASKADGLPIDYWVVTPPGYQPGKRYPTILEIHGGPRAAYADTWSSDDQVYASKGYVVLYANPRGSTSYGEAFAEKIKLAYPGQDYDDLMSVVDDAIAKGISDPDNLFVTGGSGGGVLTAWIVGKTDRFKAAVSQKPVINWSSFALTSDGYPLYSTYWFDGHTPWEDPQLYWRLSPLSLVGNVKTPTMVMVGEQDNRTPPSEAEQLYAALQLRKVPTRLIRVPGASHHGLAARPSQLLAETGAILAWFDKYRTDKPGN
ncbi:prolyl oligopeptidase family serine peptidase [Parablastomonas sp. CN1-191]|uniref:prolyl oligopeptidase family serine peptidase n=1 Tax=Parablastomonas sp. CN1-191 TaxID=3400908 RepID=UPI003BF7E31A